MRFALVGTVCAALLALPEPRAPAQQVAPVSPAPVDVDDLSILFGVAGNRLLPDISIADTGTPADRSDPQARRRPGGLIPQPLFGQVRDFAETVAGIGDLGKELEAWRVVGLRYDPCFPKIDPLVDDPTGANCIEQVRLITQPVSKSPTGDDTAMHLSYSVNGFDARTRLPTRGTALVTQRNGTRTLSPAFSRLLKLKAMSTAPTAKAPLGPHPGLSSRSASANQSFAEAVTQFIFDVCRPELLMTITYVGLDRAGGFEPWTFFGGQVAPGARQESAVIPQRWIPAAQPGSRGQLFVQFKSQTFPSGRAGVPAKFLPAHPNNDDGTVNLFALGTLLDLGPGADPSVADKAVNFTVDPVRTTPDRGDCASCHLTSLRSVNHVAFTSSEGSPSANALPFNLLERLMSEQHLGTIAAMAFVNRLHTEMDGVTAFVEFDHQPQANGPGLAGWNVRNFGYHLGKPTVSEATAMSARLITSRLNQMMGFQNPGLNCRGKWESMNQCLRFGAGRLAACARSVQCF